MSSPLASAGESLADQYGLVNFQPRLVLPGYHGGYSAKDFTISYFAQPFQTITVFSRHMSSFIFFDPRGVASALFTQLHALNSSLHRELSAKMRLPSRRPNSSGQIKTKLIRKYEPGPQSMRKL
jgi:hypothetical protein